jgi:pyridoxine 4-dehydrogenase
MRTHNITHFRRTGEFYGINPPSANLELLARFFERYPGYADKAFLSVKVRIIDSWCTHRS